MKLTQSGTELKGREGQISDDICIFGSSHPRSYSCLLQFYEAVPHLHQFQPLLTGFLLPVVSSVLILFLESGFECESESHLFILKA